MIAFLIISAIALLFSGGYFFFSIGIVAFFILLDAMGIVDARFCAGLIQALAVGVWPWLGYRVWRWFVRCEEEGSRLKTEQSLHEAAEQKRKVELKSERAGIEDEYKDLFDRVVKLASCWSTVSEMLRAAKALTGKDIARSAEGLFLVDTWEILIRIFAASGSAISVARLYAGIRIRIVERQQQNELPQIGSEYGVSDAMEELRDVGTALNCSIKTPVMVSLLASYDKLQGTHLASKAAETYLAIVVAASGYGRSVAVKMIATSYAELLNPFIVSDNGETNAGQSRTASSDKASRPSRCEECVKYYRILDLPSNAGHDEVKSKRRAFVEFLHPDQLGSKTEQARQAAEEQLKNVNEACDHILRCKAAN